MLGAGEQLLWRGEPRQGLLLRPTDAAVIPFSLLWGGFAIFWEISAFTTNAPVFFRLWGIPFVLIGLYFILGRFFMDARLRSSTSYGLTSQRVLIISGLMSRSVKSLNLNMLPEISFTERPDRSGTISFGPSVPLWMNSGFNWPVGRSTAPPAFEAIPEVRSVYEQIRLAQLAATSARTK